MNGAVSVSLLTRAAAAAVIWGAVAAAPALLWQQRGDGWGTPAADETTVYFTTRHHELVAVDIESGRERWRAHTKETGGDTLGDRTIVAGSIVATGDYGVVAFDRASGTLRWRFDPADGHAPGPYLGDVAGGLVFTGSGGGRLHAIDYETGALKWSAIFPSSHKTTVFAPIAHEDLVFAAYTEYTRDLLAGGLLAVEIDTGRIRWRRAFPLPDDPDLNTNAAGGPVLYDGRLIAASGDGFIYALHRDSGDIEWSLPPVRDAPRPHVLDPRRDFRALAVSGSTLAAGSLTGVIVAFDLTTRKERWRFLDESLVSSAMKVTADDDTVFVPFFSGQLLAIDAATGAERWRLGDWKAGFIWVPLLWKDRFFVCATREGLFAFDRVRAGP